MRPRNTQRGSVKLQSIAIIALATIVGLIVVPVWTSHAAALTGGVLAGNTHAVATVYAATLLESRSPAPQGSSGPETASAVRVGLSRPLVNPVSHSAAIVSGDDWRASGGAPAVWITSRTDVTPAALSTARPLRAALTGTIIVHTRPGQGVDFFAVPPGNGRIVVLQHLAPAI
jgi:hypothetical protein